MKPVLKRKETTGIKGVLEIYFPNDLLKTLFYIKGIKQKGKKKKFMFFQPNCLEFTMLFASIAWYLLKGVSVHYAMLKEFNEVNDLVMLEDCLC